MACRPAPGSGRSTAATRSSTSPAAASTAGTAPANRREILRFTRALDPYRRPDDRRRPRARRGLAAVEHGDDLRPPLRRGQRRALGRARRHPRRTPRPRGASASTSRAPGSRRSRKPRRRARGRSLLRSAMTLSPDRGGVFDTLAGSRSARARRPHRRRPAVHVVDALRGLRRGGALADRSATTSTGSSTSPRRIPCRTPSSCPSCAARAARRSRCQPARGWWRLARG